MFANTSEIDCKVLTSNIQVNLCWVCLMYRGREKQGPRQGFKRPLEGTQTPGEQLAFCAHPVGVRVGVEVSIEQRLGWRWRRDRLGEGFPTLLAVLQRPVPHGWEGWVTCIRGCFWMDCVSPTVDGSVGLP